MAKINDQYDIGTAFEAIENELIASMIRNFENHKQEETDEKKHWSMWQAEMLKSLEKYKHDNQKKYGKQFKDINKKIEALISLARSEGGMNQEKRILEEIKNGFPAKKITKGGTAEFFKVNDRKLDALIQATTADMQKAEAAVLRIRDNFNFRVGLGRISELGYGMLFGSDVKKQFFQKRIKGRGYCDVGTSVISEFYTPLVPKGHDFLQTIGRLAQERQVMPEQQEKE